MMDILPTLTKLTGGTPPADRKIDGGDIWPILAGAADAKTPHDTFYYYRGLKLQAIRSGPWKLHLGNGALYNLVTDIAESKDVANKNADVVARLRKLANATKDDLGIDGIGLGCRPLGKVNDARPLIDHAGKVREGFEKPSLYAGMGIMVGEVTSTSALAQVRLTRTDELVDGDVPGAAGLVQFVLEETDSVGRLVTAKPERDFITRVAFTELQPATRYTVRTSLINFSKKKFYQRGPVASFRTLPGPKRADAVRFVVVTGMNYAKFHGDNRIDRKIHLLHNNTKLPSPYAGPDKHLGYPALASILAKKPDFFVGTGDNVYYDTPKKPRAETIPQLRQKWHEQFVQPRYRDLFAAVPTYWMIDDHDYRIDDSDNTGDYAPSPKVGRRMMLEQLPVAPAEADDDEVKTYRTHRISSDLQI